MVLIITRSKSTCHFIIAEVRFIYLRVRKWGDWKSSNMDIGRIQQSPFTANPTISLWEYPNRNQTGSPTVTFSLADFTILLIIFINKAHISRRVHKRISFNNESSNWWDPLRILAKECVGVVLKGQIIISTRSRNCMLEFKRNRSSQSGKLVNFLRVWYQSILMAKYDSI